MKFAWKQTVEKIEKWATVFFLSASVFIAVLLVEAFILAFVSQFKPLFVYLSLIPALISAIFFSLFIKKDIKIIPNISIPILFIIFLVSIILIFYPHDTFGGADESVYSNYAIHLSQKASLSFPSHLNNLPDNYVENAMITPPSYRIYLATQQVLFGVQGLLRSNVILISLGLLSLFLVSLFLGGETAGLFTIILFSSSMPFLWFSRETMTENLAFFLLWSLILFFFFFLKTRRFIYLIITFIYTWLLASTRLEGFLVQFVLLLLLLPTLLFFKITNFKKSLIVTSLFFLIILSNLIIARATFLPFLKEMVPAVNYGVKRTLSAFVPQKTVTGLNEQVSPIQMKKNITINDRIPIFFALMFAKYNFLLVMFSIFLVTWQFLIHIKKHSQTRLYYLLILIIFIPEFYKFISPGVTITDPWLYRRYVYALLPFGYISFFLLLNQLVKKRGLALMFSGLVLINISLSNNIIFLKNNWGLVNKMDEITKNVSRNDFIIIDKTPLRNYSPGSFLIINKGIRSAASSILWLYNYFPENKIFNGVHYNKLFLLSTNYKNIYSSFDIVTHKLVDTPVYSSFDIVSRKSADVEYTQLVPSCQLYLLGEEEGLTNPYNVGMLPFSDAVKYCSEPGNKIAHYKETLYLYELVYDKI